MRKNSASKSILNFTKSLTKGTICRGLMKLQEIDLSSNNIYFLPLSTYKDQKYLWKSLNLDSNGFSSVQHVTMSSLQNLTILYLRYNKITLFSESGIKNAMSLSNTTLFIKENPINCECTHILSLKRLRENQDIFGDLNETYCINSKGMSISKFSVSLSI